VSAELSLRIKQHLLDSIGHMKQIKTCMLDEQQALQARELEQIETIAKQKNQLLEEVKADIEQRQQLIEGAGFSVDDSGMEQLIDSLPENFSAALSKGWQQLVGLHEEVQELNQTNGMIINKGLQQVDTMLGVVRGNPETRTSRTYNAKGRSVASSTRTLGQA